MVVLTESMTGLQAVSGETSQWQWREDRLISSHLNDELPQDGELCRCLNRFVCILELVNLCDRWMNVVFLNERRQFIRHFLTPGSEECLDWI